MIKLSVWQTKNLATVLWISISWTFISITQLLYDFSIQLSPDNYHPWGEVSSIYSYFILNTLIFLFNGFIAGLVIIYFLRDWIRSKPFLQGLILGVVVYTTLFIALTSLHNYLIIETSFLYSSTSITFYERLIQYLTSYDFIRNYCFWIIVLIGTLLTLFINDKFGPGIFRKFLAGSYFVPRKEKRIFMFLDLKGSTQIAEKLGEFRYFQFLQKTFKDITTAVLLAKAEIYQYVGDEIVLCWKIKEGVEKMRCIQFYFDVCNLIENLKLEYEQDFEVIPKFKAGVHLGSVTVGEIGVIKRDIVYSGDVLNTTARIQKKCNDLGRSILFSSDLMELLPTYNFEFESMGKIKLQGKSEEITLFTCKEENTF